MTDEELIQYMSKDIEVTYKNGFKLAGHSCDFEWGDDEEEACLGIYEDFHEWNYVGISPGEVDSIKVI